MILAALTALGVSFVTFGLARLRALDIQHRKAVTEDEDPPVLAHVGGALFIGIGVGVVVLGWNPVNQLTLVEPDRPSGRCRRCRRALRDAESVKRGFGPVCAAKDTARATDAFDLAFEIAWAAADQGSRGEHAIARRWYRAGAEAQAKTPPPP